MSIFRVVLFVLGIVLAVNATSQEIHYYDRITDPRAITRLDNIDNEPVRIVSKVGWPQGPRDPIDGFHILAQDTGAGIITHIWTQLHNQEDSNTFFRIHIDDSLVAQGHLYSFFKQSNGAFRAPFDSLCSGAQVCDIQMPYKSNFRITYYADWSVCCLFWAVEYKRLKDSSLIESFRNPPSDKYMKELAVAEKRYSTKGSIWNDNDSKSIHISKNLSAGETLILCDLATSGVIDTAVLRKLRLVVFWDGSPYPSIDVPLPDFFGAGAGLRNINSYWQYTTKSGEFTSYLPMPFAKHAKIVLVNTSHFDIPVLADVVYHEEFVDRSVTGYLHAQFNVSLPAKFGIAHPGATVYGRGRYVGVHMGFPSYRAPYFLEGDPIFEIDHKPEYLIRYTGMEDYLNGGYFFEDGGFSLPFAGCPDLWHSAYRWHVLDPYDFHNYMSVRFEHGFRNDYQTDFRTVVFYYKQWTPFWVSGDSVRTGEMLTVGGAGYAPNQEIAAKIGVTPFFTTNANAKGEFVSVVPVPSIAPGEYDISINGLSMPEAFTILTDPVLKIIRDSVPYLYRYKEQIHLRGIGFSSGTKVSLYIDTTLIIPSITIDSNYLFDVYTMTPWLPDGSYAVTARTEDGKLVICDSMIRITRTLQYEFENLYPPYYQQDDAWPNYLGYIADTNFSQHNTGYFWAKSAGKAIGFKFSTPVADTFDVSLFYGKGRRYGNYDIYIDSVYAGDIVGYYDTNYYYETVRSKALHAGTWYFEKGTHTIEFRCTGTHPTSTEYLLDIDNMILTPVTTFKPIPGDSTLDTPNVVGNNGDVLIRAYPNPAAEGRINVSISSKQFQNSSAIVTLKLYDLFGNEKLSDLFYMQEKVEEIRELDISSLSGGSYFVSIVLNSNGQTKTYVVSVIII
jgi:hypothetical protein